MWWDSLQQLNFSVILWRCKEKSSLGAPRGSVDKKAMFYKKLNFSNFFGKKFFLKLDNFQLPYRPLKLGTILVCGSKPSLTLVLQTMFLSLRKKKLFELTSKFKAFLLRLFCFVSRSLMEVSNFHFSQYAKFQIVAEPKKVRSFSFDFLVKENQCSWKSYRNQPTKSTR